ncbi:6,7-dimethyl-8-ribityllumazine synthase [Siccirubricoccus sp. KC 17139]|uniref:6,7-dimethyl-8-ribityllumazine synthase n=1 Tax=Siccirubricoccus soli TaxID=2899147 RepID=A0ABT1D509_9PROT|nr:6,7-dimethyl-8-ribityllumazine synthase [Siccirubricoccus soli]MCO6417009.1 6,7-dimethyl-8-ribityllumazine synthase [Siccirubricoccus soli]MCP2683144.1 6,7-dimethyl-8-ribityllumazine synthase [Siccirubricoccus soli]
MSTIDAPERVAEPVPGPAPRLLVIEAPYYEAVVSGMRRGAEQVFAAAGATHRTVAVAGGYELPAALRMALSQTQEQYDGFLLLGCVVKGETDHYDFICTAICQGVMDISSETGAAIGFGLLTVDTLAQAIARSGDDKHNKGAEAAHALLGQLRLRRHWGL